eukprot:TRINITY_DN4575_c1_g1_i1.p2 TRINITY_DN4575_c1_g1~~TRINITY_DN4575_c1_g1_i1.p2  ORF type:complete len:102 (+),score=12.86 TRINITY_DN4575_c1_g1_i1:454-759(+)
MFVVLFLPLLCPLWGKPHSAFPFVSLSALEQWLFVLTIVSVAVSAVATKSRKGQGRKEGRKEDWDGAELGAGCKILPLHSALPLQRPSATPPSPPSSCVRN